LLTQAVLPAVIFSELAVHPIAGRQLLLVLAMLVAGVVSLVVAWGAGIAMRLERQKIGALMIVSAFGSSALLGYPLIQFAFPNNPQAMVDAILVSELGVGLPIFTICPVIAMYFGSSSRDGSAFYKTLLGYFRSPVFVAVVAGLAASRLPIPLNNPFVAPFFESFRMIEGALTIVACLILGIQLDFKAVRGIWPLIIVSAVIQMWLQPFVANAQATLYHIAPEQRQVLVLISAMPSAVLGPVFATRFQCASDTASALVFINILLSLVMIPLTFGVLVR
jgi:hypothetical protein